MMPEAVLEQPQNANPVYERAQPCPVMWKQLCNNLALMCATPVWVPGLPAIAKVDTRSSQPSLEITDVSQSEHTQLHILTTDHWLQAFLHGIPQFRWHLEADPPEHQGIQDAKELVDVFMGVPHSEEVQGSCLEFEAPDKVTQQLGNLLILSRCRGIVCLNPQMFWELQVFLPANGSHPIYCPT